MTSLLTEFLPWIGGALFAVLAIFGWGKLKEREGARKLELKQRREQDRRVKGARDVAEKTRADVADADTDDLDQRLRDAGL